SLLSIFFSPLLYHIFESLSTSFFIVYCQLLPRGDIGMPTLKKEKNFYPIANLPSLCIQKNTAN
ncbi:MAG: hypothetical protein IJ323_00730, partial [Clostridia bacterium]|nr:hypothetical protein [Clostridia bacterium]